ncbi:MAG TPA: hypothetical protein DD670_16955 [Planctomycetaceae bacterium]|nr:hypothetical protein [Planctomycetaceae bacterium]
MWRAFFLAIGVTLCIVGVEFLGLERVVLNIHERPAATPKTDLFGLPVSQPGPGPRKVIVAREYTPWSLLAMGMVVILYAYDLPRRMNQK